MKFLINNNNGKEVCNILAQLLNHQFLIHKSNINKKDRINNSNLPMIFLEFLTNNKHP